MVLEPNCRLVFTARTGTDLRIISRIGLQIAIVSGPECVQIRISCNESGTHQMGPKHLQCQINFSASPQQKFAQTMIS